MQLTPDYLPIRYTFRFRAGETDDELGLEGPTPFSAALEIARCEGLNSIDRLSYQSSQQSFSGDPACLDLVKAWFEDCVQNHKECEPVSRDWYPTRLLYLDNDYARLIICDEERPTGPYATLSHCWGKEPFKVLNKSTLAQFRNGIPIATFLASFRDAMRVVLSLGLKYIWIDCCTIFQGDDDFSRLDFEQEAKLMHLVYANGAINIGAASAGNPYHGCFPSRVPLKTRWSTFPSNPSTGGPTHLVFDSQSPANALSDLNQSPLFSRGWVMQERTLSNRMVHFTDSQILWTCNTCGRFEAAPIASHPKATEKYRETQCLPGSVKLHTAWDDKRAHLLFLWNVIMQQYSALGLTYPERDKLYAIAGVGIQVAKLLGYTYINGIMMEMLPSSLLWSALEDDETGARPQRTQNRSLPSWSWASMDGPVNFDGCNFPENNINYHKKWKRKPTAEMSVLLSKIMHGQVGAAETLMMIVGRLVPITGHIEHGSNDEDQRCEIRLKESSGHDPALKVFIPDDLIEWDEATGDEDTVLYALLLCDDGAETTNMIFIVIAKNPDGMFRRLGIASVRLRLWDAWHEMLRRTKPSLVLIR
jgi:hypothetical protein